MDFAFGTYINDAMKLANHRAMRTGIQHMHQIMPIDPLPGDAVRVRLVMRGNYPANHAAIYYTNDETTPAGSRGVAQNGQVVMFKHIRTRWDSIIWDYLTHWEAVIPPQPDSTLVQYIISAWREDGDENYADWPHAYDSVQHEAMIYFKNIPADTEFTPNDPLIPQVFNYHVDRIQPPDWANDAVIYQVFVDRFYPGDGREWKQTENLRDFLGGTLWGIRDKLDYIAELGANCIWLSPTWLSPSYHGYDISDYMQVAPWFGGEEALHAVVKGAHARGIRVLLDLPCNHLSREHPYFIDALQNPESLYREWFFIDARYEHGYKAFFNVPSMPEINLVHPGAREWMIDNALYWLREFDIDGYRLDYANGPGPVFWSYFRRACKTTKPDCLLFGEIIEPPGVLKYYAGRLDGCLDFTMNDAFRRTFAWEAWNEAEFEAFIENHNAYFPGGFLMPTFLDNHDMDRFSFIAQNDTEKLKAAVRRQFSLPNPPVILNGTEVGLRQVLSTREHMLDVNRVPMVWEDDQDQDLLAFYKAQIQARKAANS